MRDLDILRHHAVCTCPKPTETMDDLVRANRFAGCEKHGRGTHFWLQGVQHYQPSSIRVVTDVGPNLTG